MKTFRCPVDDVVFETVNIHRTPTLQGHPECPGPECRKSFKGYKNAEVAKPIAAAVQQPQTHDESLAAGVGPIPSGQGW